MKQWIRWSGLAAFVVVAGLLVAFFMLAAGPLIKWGIERFGSQAAGARVEVESVSLNFSPLGFTLNHLTVADADQPMSNVLELGKATAELETAPLLLGKAIIRELSVEGMQFGTARTTSGALEKAVEEVVEEDAVQAEESSSDSLMSGVELPSADDILARESLKTEAAGNAFKESYATHKAEVNDTVAAVPDSAALAAYEKELKALSSGEFKSLDDFKERKKKLDDLKARFKQDKAAVAAAKKAIADARTDIAARLTELKKAPGEDLASIRSKYKLTADGAANLSALLFGSQAGEWAEQALYWYEKVKPYLSSDDAGNEEKAAKAERAGRFVHFPTSDPWPEFLLRNAHMTADTSHGKLFIEAEDVTHQPAVLGRPAHVVVNGAGLQQVEDLTLDLVSDHRKAPGSDTLTLTVKDWALKGMNLGVAGTELKQAMVQVQGLAVVSKGQLNAQGDAQFLQTRFASESKTTFARELGSALDSIQSFDIRAKARGDITSPDVELGSDLDKQLSAAFSARMKQKQDELEAKLQAALNKKLEQYVGGYADELKQLNQLDGSLDDKLKQIQSLGEAKLEDYQAQQERKAKEKLDAEKAAAKADADRKKKEAEAKAKEKLKKLL
ncbi:TIGR03545 family protein [Thalassolituus sp. LLYu03]|uniref:TIGR03545 family protein n=1 Tax=Thalassolituus sp. LLYu03 TaxID=3421656 RepID=UPI003D2CC23D